jgi:hypothetical protein
MDWVWGLSGRALPSNLKALISKPSTKKKKKPKKQKNKTQTKLYMQISYFTLGKTEVPKVRLQN